MGILADNNVDFVFHYSPLHYLVFIASQGELLSKPALAETGFTEAHFRSTSYRQDLSRGFADYVHLAIDPRPPILRAKLASGFPHFELQIPSTEIECGAYDLCRFNIAKTRYFRGAKQEPPESPKNGRYYDGKAIPIARTDTERRDLFHANFAVNMIEVLVPHRLTLPRTTVVTLFHPLDALLAERIKHAHGIPWELRLEEPVHGYARSEVYGQQVSQFVERALGDPNWKGDGLEFDRV